MIIINELEFKIITLIFINKKFDNIENRNLLLDISIKITKFIWNNIIQT